MQLVLVAPKAYPAEVVIGDDLHHVAGQDNPPGAPVPQADLTLGPAVPDHSHPAPRERLARQMGRVLTDVRQPDPLVHLAAAMIIGMATRLDPSVVEIGDLGYVIRIMPLVHVGTDEAYAAQPILNRVVPQGQGVAWPR